MNALAECANRGTDTESIGRDHLYAKAVLQQLAEDADRSDWVNERIGLIAPIEKSHASLAQFGTDTKYASLWGERGGRILP